MQPSVFYGSYCVWINHFQFLALSIIQGEGGEREREREREREILPRLSGRQQEVPW